jgi:hypothetical protein
MINGTKITLTEIEVWKLRALVSEIGRLELQTQTTATALREARGRSETFWRELAATHGFDPETPWRLDPEAGTLTRGDAPSRD